MNCLLIPNYEPSKNSKKDTDAGLLKIISLDEFIIAINRYKRIMATEFPNRSQELDDYMSHIIEIASIWPDKFYEYDKLFSSKCANILYQFIKIIDWLLGDPDLRQLLCAGSKVRACENC